MQISWVPRRPTTLSRQYYSFTSIDAASRGCSKTQLGSRITIAKRGRALCTASLDPWKTLGVPHDANEAAIKKAYRKLALQNHPDLKGSQAANRFVKIQEAYEVVTGKRRGSTVDETQQQPATAGSWDFHDWYWKFTASKRWDQQKHKKPSSAPQPPRPTGAPQAALQEQLAGLKRKAAYRRVSQRASGESAQAEPHHSASRTPGTPYTQPAAAAAQDSGHQAHSSGSSRGSSSHEHQASAQLAGLRRRAAMRMQAQQPQAARPTPNEGSPVGDAQHMRSNAAAAIPPLHPSPANEDAHMADLRAKQTVSVQQKQSAAAASSARSSASPQSIREADSMQEANAAVPWRSKHSTARSTFSGSSAFSISIVGHPLADIDILKCMREISSHLSWR